uniref:Calponin-homology (CH) domain-containing protein n=1 Tax=Apteryx owenii TaxID=8824 RepID=A0A8B9QMJ9_APTOW
MSCVRLCLWRGNPAFPAARPPAGVGFLLVLRAPLSPALSSLADERDRVQKKTFTKWVNKHLIKVRRHINDLYEDLRDGHNLISLLEVLSGDTLPREKGRMRFHKLQNVQIALNYLKHRQVKLVNIRNDDIADGNPKLTLGLIWTIILHFQVSRGAAGPATAPTGRGPARVTRRVAADLGHPGDGAVGGHD